MLCLLPRSLELKNRLFDVNTGYRAFQELAKSATFAVTRLKNEPMSYLYGLSFSFAAPLVTATNRLFDVNIGYSAFHGPHQSATFAVLRLKNEAMSYSHVLIVLFASPLVLATNR